MLSVFLPTLPHIHIICSKVSIAFEIRRKKQKKKTEEKTLRNICIRKENKNVYVETNSI